MARSMARAGAIAGAVLVAALAAPAAASAGDPFFGMLTDDVSLTREAQRSELDRQAATGIGVVREHVFWDRIERSPGVYDFARMDQLVADAADRGLQILPMLAHPPAFRSSRPPGSTTNANFPPEDPIAMGQFAAQLVRRYGPNGTFWCRRTSLPARPTCRQPYVPITAWQVWNEPDHRAWWGLDPDVNEYALLLGVVSTFIKLASPSAEVVTAGLLGASAGAGGYIEQLYQRGAALYFDILALHPYGEDVGAMLAPIRAARATTQRALDGRAPILVSEFGWATAGLRSVITTTPECQAALLHAATRRLAELRAPLNLRGAIQFQWTDRAPAREIWPYFSGLVELDGTPKPSLAAFTQGVAGRPAPAGFTLAEACPPERRDLG